MKMGHFDGKDLLGFLERVDELRGTNTPESNYYSASPNCYGGKYFRNTEMYTLGGLFGRTLATIFGYISCHDDTQSNSLGRCRSRKRTSRSSITEDTCPDDQLSRVQ